MTKWLLGIDEAGRGPLAGPVAVGAVVVRDDFDWKLIPGVGDSKKITPLNRQAIALRAQQLKQAGKIDFRVRMVGATVIDRIGITAAVRLGIKRACLALALDPRTTSVKLDGLLVAPAMFTDQETIVRGDATEKTIGLASILAKVTRDQYMVRAARKYPVYGFEVHKGYGTRAHCAAVKKYRLSDIHRQTFCRGLLNP